jgi:hypothetical protein
MSMSVGAENGPYLKLPLWRTICISYANYFRHFGDVLRISVLWLLPIAALNGAMGWLQASWIADITATPQTQAIPSQPIPITVLGGISNLALALAAVSTPSPGIGYCYWMSAQVSAVATSAPEAFGTT